ncbi:unnamed protein product [Cylindrotheca closterium]|uniref:Uncharacterized protein n=1 Tax=Cylindrotheca closterium TaxID=2856 RepID=A0AAD2FLU0_9STRA|nr:unnamed protein product [Cylindrotheca closterium]
MSERMIEMHRAKLLGQTPPPSIGTPTGQPQNLTQAPRAGTQPQQAKANEKLSPADAALRKLQKEDIQMQRFIHRLQRRNDSHPSFESISGPTVPTALSRRMLHRQGVGYLDDTVGAVISASADRFLATVLQQGIACRDQRLKGLELAKEAANQRKRHIQHYDEETIDRKRRREQTEENREKEHLAAIATAEALNKKGGKAEERKKKKTKKADEAASPTNGATKSSANKDDDDDESYDSIDEEEEYYRKNQDPGSLDRKYKNDEDEEDDTILLRDLQRPLEAWKFNLLGKESLEIYSSSEEEEEDDDEDEDESNGNMMEDNPNDESMLFQGIMESGNASTKQSDDGDKTKRKSSSPKS